MSETMFTQVLRLIQGVFSAPTEADVDALFKETLLLTLSRATSADTNIAPCEVDDVRRIYENETGESLEVKDVRIAALSDIYREVSFESLLAKAKIHINADDKMRIVKALAEVIHSDDKINAYETEFFNKVTAALGLTAADVSVLIKS